MSAQFFSIEFLHVHVPKRIALWERNVITDVETVNWLLDECAQTLVKRPDSSQAVEAILDTVPEALLAKMAMRLQQHRCAEGRWHWPLGGPYLCTPPVRQTRQFAEPHEELAISLLQGCLSGIQARRAASMRPAAHAGDLPSGEAAESPR